MGTGSDYAAAENIPVPGYNMPGSAKDYVRDIQRGYGSTLRSARAAQDAFYRNQARSAISGLAAGTRDWSSLSQHEHTLIKRYWGSLSTSQKFQYRQAQAKGMVTEKIREPAMGAVELAKSKFKGVKEDVVQQAEEAGTRAKESFFDFHEKGVSFTEALGTNLMKPVTVGGTVEYLRSPYRGRGSETLGEVASGVKERVSERFDIKSDITASLNRGSNLLDRTSQIGEEIGMNITPYFKSGVAAEYAAEHIEKYGFRGGTYEQERTRIETGLGLKGESLSNYLGRLDIAESTLRETGYFEDVKRMGELQKVAEGMGWLREGTIYLPDTTNAKLFMAEYEPIYTRLQSKSPELSRYERIYGNIEQYNLQQGQGAFQRDVSELNRQAEALAQLQQQAYKGFEMPEGSKTWAESEYNLRDIAIGQAISGPLSPLMPWMPGKYGREAWGEYKTKPIVEGYQQVVGIYQESLHKLPGWDVALPENKHLAVLVKTGRYVVEKTPEYLSFIPLSIAATEAVTKEPKLIGAALVPGSLLMARGMAHEAYKEPVGFAASMVATAGIMKGAQKISPIQYTGRMEFPTGKSIVKSKYMLGESGVPKEVLAWQERGIWATDVLDVSRTKIPSVYRHTYAIPETVVHRGFYFQTPSKGFPYKGVHPITGVTWGPKGTIRGLTIGESTVHFRSPIQSYSGYVSEEVLLRRLSPSAYVDYLVKRGNLEFKYATEDMGHTAGFIREGRPPEIFLGRQYKGLRGSISSIYHAKLSELEGKWNVKTYGVSDTKSYLSQGYQKAYGVEPIFPEEVPFPKVYRSFIKPTKSQLLFHELTHYRYPSLSEPQVRALDTLYGAGKLGSKPFEVMVPKTSYEFSGLKMRSPAATEVMFELPLRFRSFTGVEGKYTLRSMRESLPAAQQELFDAAFYLQETLGRQKAYVKQPIRLQDIEYMPKEAIPEITQIMRKYRGETKLYGSAAKEVSMARKTGEIGGITPGDIDIEILTTTSRMREGLVFPKKYQSMETLSELGKPTPKHEFIKRLGEKMPGLTPEKYAREVEAVMVKHLGRERVEVTINPQYEMWSVNILPEGVRAGTPKLGEIKTPGFEAVFDIHPESAQFEFGLPIQKTIKTRLDPGFKEPFWKRWQRFDVTPLSEEFQRSFGSLMQVAEKGGEKVLMPKVRRIKDVGRFVQTAKTGAKYYEIEAYAIKSKSMMAELPKINEAISKWERYSKTFTELTEMQEHIAASPMDPIMQKILIKKVQRESVRGMLASEEALLLPRTRPLPSYTTSDLLPFVEKGSSRGIKYATGVSKQDPYYPFGIKTYTPSSGYGYRIPVGTGMKKASSFRFIPFVATPFKPYSVERIDDVYALSAYKPPSTSQIMMGVSSGQQTPSKSLPIPVITPSHSQVATPPPPIGEYTPTTPPPPIGEYTPTTPPPPIGEYTPTTPPPPIPVIQEPPPPFFPFWPEEEKPKRRKKRIDRDIEIFPEQHWIATLPELMGWGASVKTNNMKRGVSVSPRRPREFEAIPPDLLFANAGAIPRSKTRGDTKQGKRKNIGDVDVYEVKIPNV